MLAGVVGCNQTYYVTKDDLEKSKELFASAPNLENNPSVGAAPVTELSLAPPTINSPDRPIRFISLAEAMAIALEQGTIGNTSLQIANISNPGGTNEVQTFNENLVQFNGGAGGRVAQSDSMRVLRLDPAIIGAGIESSLSKFDAVWTSSASWSTTDRPIASSTDQVQTGGQNINAIQQQDASFATGLVKPLPEGGVANITFRTDYQFTNLPARVNPSYRPSLQFGIEQPLLQGFGTEINQLRSAHPGVLFNNASFGVLNTQPTAEGILITRVRFDQQRAEFERNIQFMVTNVELAYWNLYYGYWNLYAQEQGLRFAYEAWKISKSQLDAGRVAIDAFAQTRGQYETFRAQRLGALSQVLDQERNLRGMLGLPINDGKRLVPSDQPTLAPYQPDWETAQNEALALKPELYLARQEVKVAQMNLVLQKNSLLPDLRLGATYDINSIGSRLDGPDDNNALRQLSSNHFNNWTVQARLNVPIGFRTAHANVRIAQLQLARAYETLADQERKTIQFLGALYRRVGLQYELIRTNRSAREAFGQQLQVKYNKFIAGRENSDQFLEAQRFWADALSKEYQAIRDYNQALAAFEFAKGTALTRNNIVIAEGGLPTFASQRAVEHLAERSAALTIHERPAPTPLSASLPEPGVIGNPTLENSAPRLSELFKQSPPLKDAPALPPVMPKTDEVKAPATTTPLPLSPLPVAEPLTVPTAPGISKDQPKTLPALVSPVPAAKKPSTFATGRTTLPDSLTPAP